MCPLVSIQSPMQVLRLPVATRALRFCMHLSGQLDSDSPCACKDGLLAQDTRIGQNADVNLKTLVNRNILSDHFDQATLPHYLCGLCALLYCTV